MTDQQTRPRPSPTYFPRSTFDPAGPAPRIAVLGTGYLGATHAVAMAELGFEVVGVDTDPHKVDDARRRQGAVLRARAARAARAEQLATGRLRFTTDVGRGRRAGATCTSSASAPRRSKTSHAADLRFVEAATTAIAKHLTHDALIVGKSTVPVGTARPPA